MADQKENRMQFIQNKSTRAVVCGSLSGILVAVTNLSVKIGSSMMSPFQILTMMCAGQLVISIVIASYRRKGFTFKLNDAFPLMARSVAMSLARMLYYVAIARLPVFDAETLKNTRSIFTLILLVLTCQENPGIVEFGAGIITFTGVTLVCRPKFLFRGNGDVSTDWIGIVFALMSAFCHASGYIFTKKIPHLHYTVMTFYEFLVQGIGSACVSLMFGEYTYPTNIKPYIITIIATCSLFSTNSLQIYALSLGSAAVVAITINLNVPSLLCLQAIIQNIFPATLALVGSIFVLTGVTIISFRTQLKIYMKRYCYCCEDNLEDEEEFDEDFTEYVNDGIDEMSEKKLISRANDKTCCDT
ncbi:Uncharacterised protein g8280 [Pycnogonum litorale]